MILRTSVSTVLYVGALRCCSTLLGYIRSATDEGGNPVLPYFVLHTYCDFKEKQKSPTLVTGRGCCESRGVSPKKLTSGIFVTTTNRYLYPYYITPNILSTSGYPQFSLKPSSHTPPPCYNEYMEAIRPYYYLVVCEDCKTEVPRPTFITPALTETR